MVEIMTVATDIIFFQIVYNLYRSCGSKCFQQNLNLYYYKTFRGSKILSVNATILYIQLFRILRNQRLRYLPHTRINNPSSLLNRNPLPAVLFDPKYYAIKILKAAKSSFLAPNHLTDPLDRSDLPSSNRFSATIHTHKPTHLTLKITSSVSAENARARVSYTPVWLCALERSTCLSLSRSLPVQQLVRSAIGGD